MYEDIFMEGYYDALCEMEDDYDDYDELEEAYLEGYYTALMESSKNARKYKEKYDLKNPKGGITNIAGKKRSPKEVGEFIERGRFRLNEKTKKEIYDMRERKPNYLKSKAETRRAVFSKPKNRWKNRPATDTELSSRGTSFKPKDKNELILGRILKNGNIVNDEYAKNKYRKMDEKLGRKPKPFNGWQ